MNNLYISFNRQKTWGYFLTGLLLWLRTASAVWAQVPSCGPNQILTGYFGGATGVISTTGTVTNSNDILGAADGTTTTLNANSGITVDMGLVLTAGNSLAISYKSSDLTAPLQVLVASSATGPYTNIAQLSGALQTPGSNTLTTSSITLPVDTRYIRLSTTGTVYDLDAVTYPIYKCVNNPAPTCAAGQTLLTYSAGSQSVNATTGTVTGSANATGPPDGVVATLNYSSITLDLGSVVAAGNILSLVFSSQYTKPLPLQVSVSQSANGPFTNIGSFSGNGTTTTGNLRLPLDTRYVRLAIAAPYSAYYIDAVTYSIYSCVPQSAISCASGQQPVYSSIVGAKSVVNTTGGVGYTAEIIGFPNGSPSTLDVNSSLTVDMGSAMAAGNTLTFTYRALNTESPLQIWTATSVWGAYTFIGTLPSRGTMTTGQLTLPLGLNTLRWLRVVVLTG
ncbi:hypothetical protein GO730_26810 [Spirosoma sp. HMF3257]|uniref:F5/8 type C domain-containing protein n=1 Tax=Spirosoma telluris TaxID=2183553 RepID=A0A327NN53_9BACT|nr:hypothetical protein [Spirosoma telluris]RAI76871.1 hypothetical protein HMF3257_26730 [Spirosoma telluris]